MDLVLSNCDRLFLDRAWASVFPAPSPSDSTPAVLKALASWGHGATSPSASLESATPLSLFPRDSILRQYTSLYLLALVAVFLLYFAVSTLSYYCLFDRRLEHHPRFIPGQVRKEIALSVKSMPVMDVITIPWFVAEVRGHSRLYDGWLPGGPGTTTYCGLGPVAWTIASVVLFMVFTDYSIYWIHRWLHLPWFYKRLHKPHHRWLVPTPFASMAFHPLDGYAQSVPYHLIVHILPMNKYLYIGLFALVNMWTILIHDGDMISGHFLEAYINSPAHHTLHHLYFTCNYGQYFTWADYYNGSYRPPRPELDPIHESLKNLARKEKLKKDEERKARRAARQTLGVEDAGAESDSGYEGSEMEDAEKEDKKRR